MNRELIIQSILYHLKFNLSISVPSHVDKLQTDTEQGEEASPTVLTLTEETKHVQACHTIHYPDKPLHY